MTAFLGGGLAGAVFSWLVNRREPTVVTYLVNRTELADPRASALIPNLSVHVGKESIEELHAFTIDIDVPRGSEVERAQVGIFFPHKVRIYGKSTETPSQLFNINCNQVENGVTCQLGPMSRANDKGYRIVLATDEKESPKVEVAAKDIQVLSASEFAASKASLWESLGSSKAGGIIIGLLGVASIFVAQIALLRRVWRRGSGLDAGVVVGKVVDQDGNPIKDADVEVVLESPSHTFSPTTTDRFGDFLLGGLRKFSLYKGRVRITQPDYRAIETAIDSPIVCLKLERPNR